MPRRTFWLATGVAIGAGSSLWAERRVRRTLEQATARLQPDALVVEVGRSARQVADTTGSRVRNAFSSGRDEMLRREEELWAGLAAEGVATDLVVTVPERDPPRPTARNEPSRRAARVRRRRRPPAKSPSHLGQ